MDVGQRARARAVGGLAEHQALVHHHDRLRQATEVVGLGGEPRGGAVGPLGGDDAGKYASAYQQQPNE